MRRPPSIAPSSPEDIDVYLVLDDFGGRLGRAWRESDEERTDRRTLSPTWLTGSTPIRPASSFSTRLRVRRVMSPGNLLTRLARGAP